LSAGEFAAIRGAGFEPVGQVFGACVYNIGYVGAYGCAGGWSSGDLDPFGAVTRVSGQDGFGVRPMVEAMYEARHKAIDRMTAECAGLGGHGIVSVSLTLGEFPFGGLEFGRSARPYEVRARLPCRTCSAPICPARTSPSSFTRAGCRLAWRWGSRSGPGMMTGRPLRRPPGVPRTPRWTAIPNSSI
jgi:hypothetical protein